MTTEHKLPTKCEECPLRKLNLEARALDEAWRVTEFEMSEAKAQKEGTYNRFVNGMFFKLVDSPELTHEQSSAARDCANRNLGGECAQIEV